MKIGIQLPSFTWPDGPAKIRPHLMEISRTTEELGFASLWVMDHFFQIQGVGPVDDPMLESYTTLGCLAGITQSIRLGALVTCAVYRHPAVLVKQVTTLDVLSGGRAYFGIGAGWFEREAAGLGIPFPGRSERFERLEETLLIAKQMWSGQVGSFSGRHYTLAETRNQPEPLSQPHPPILIGGMGEKKTLRLVAKYADACNLMLHAGFDTLRQKIETLKRYCDEENRAFDGIERTILGGLPYGTNGLDVDKAIQLCKELSELGFQHLIVNVPDVYTIKPLITIGQDLIPAVESL